MLMGRNTLLQTVCSWTSFSLWLNHAVLHYIWNTAIGFFCKCMRPRKIYSSKTTTVMISLSFALWVRFQYFTDLDVNSERHQPLSFLLSWTSKFPGHFCDRKRLQEQSRRYTGAHRFHRLWWEDVSILTHVALKFILMKVPEIVPVTQWEIIKIVAEWKFISPLVFTASRPKRGSV